MVSDNQNKTTIQHSKSIEGWGSFCRRSRPPLDLPQLVPQSASAASFIQSWCRVCGFVGPCVLLPHEVDERVGLTARVDAQLENLGRDVAATSLKAPVF